MLEGAGGGVGVEKGQTVAGYGVPPATTVTEVEVVAGVQDTQGGESGGEIGVEEGAAVVTMSASVTKEMPQVLQLSLPIDLYLP